MSTPDGGPACERCGNTETYLSDSLGVWWKCYRCDPYGHGVRADNKTAASFGKESEAALDFYDKNGRLP